MHYFMFPVQWKWRATYLTFSPRSSHPCSPPRQGSPRRRRGQVESATDAALDRSLHASFYFIIFFNCSACSLFWCPPVPLHLFLVCFIFSSLSLFGSSAVSLCLPLDPFTSADAGDDSMPNLNPFLSKLVVDASHLPAVSSDGVSFSTRTSAHEMFGGNDSHFVFSPLSSLMCCWCRSMM